MTESFKLVGVIVEVEGNSGELGNIVMADFRTMVPGYFPLVKVRIPIVGCELSKLCGKRVDLTVTISEVESNEQDQAKADCA